MGIRFCFIWNASFSKHSQTNEPCFKPFLSQSFLFRSYVICRTVIAYDWREWDRQTQKMIESPTLCCKTHKIWSVIIVVVVWKRTQNLLWFILFTRCLRFSFFFFCFSTLSKTKLDGARWCAYVYDFISFSTCFISFFFGFIHEILLLTRTFYGHLCCLSCDVLAFSQARALNIIIL